MSDDVCFHLQTFYGSLARAAGFPRDFFSRGSHWLAHVRTCSCVSFSWYRHTQLVFSGGLAPFAAQRADGTGTEQQGGPPLGRAEAWPWPLACKVRSGALGGKGTPKACGLFFKSFILFLWKTR
jgi:hypothetical protein